jgi:hypothetical protein
MYTGVISTLSTVLIASVTFLQWKIAKNKRQDDLFNLRYKLYEKIIEFIIEVKTDLFASCLDDKYLSLAKNIIFESENLFGVDIANHLKKYLLSKESFFDLIDEGKADDYSSWSPPVKFREPFKKYLTIKS